MNIIPLETEQDVDQDTSVRYMNTEVCTLCSFSAVISVMVLLVVNQMHMKDVTHQTG